MNLLQGQYSVFTVNDIVLAEMFLNVLINDML